MSGEGSQGYLKVVSPDTRYLEVKWERPKGAVSVPDALEKYLNRLRRAARKTRQELRVRQRPRGLGAIRPQREAPIPYTWEADRKAVGCIWHCGECGRLVIAEVVGQPEDDLAPAAAILRGIRDHGEEGWNTWALYGLEVPAPQRFGMERQWLRTGHQRFMLRHRGTRVQADRWGLAEIALRGTNVREWFESRERAHLMRYAYRVTETQVNGHAAYALVGRDRLLTALLKLARVPATLTWPRFFMRGVVWQCPETNRIYAVVGEQARRDTLVDEIIARMACHH